MTDALAVPPYFARLRFYYKTGRGAVPKGVRRDQTRLASGRKSPVTSEGGGQSETRKIFAYDRIDSDQAKAIYKSINIQTLLNLYHTFFILNGWSRITK